MEISIDLLAYVLIFVAGLTYSIARLALGQIGSDHGDLGHETVDSTGHEFMHGFSIPSIFMFLTYLGGFGILFIISTILDSYQTLIASTIIAVIGTYLTLRAYWYMTKDSPSSAISIYEAKGKIGTTAVPIPENGIGEVGVVIKGQYFKQPAREVSNSSIDVNKNVEVLEIIDGRYLLVKEVK